RHAGSRLCRHLQHDPYRYLTDVLERLPTQPASQITELLPHLWRPIAQLH
ncbi:MAG: transposase domain-containing protein, partial [Betaproteobacteria bacterium]|nr:transposase domain-containing protein [Betaproteobacteria bacterium]